MSKAGTVVILAAGQGTRMKSARPKVLHELCGRPMIGWVIEQALSLDPDRIVVVVGHGADEVRAYAAACEGAERIECVTQEPQNGTGHAMQVAAPVIPEDSDSVVVLYGDMPVLGAWSLESLMAGLEAAAPSGMSMLTAYPANPHGFGRIDRGQDGEFKAIVEHKDASSAQLEIGEINLGVYAFPRKQLLEYLPRLSNGNAQGEYYLTDVCEMFVTDGASVAAAVLEDLDEAIGVNDLTQLAEARWALQVRILEEHMLAGVRIEDPASCYIDVDVEIGPDTRILPCTVIRSGVKIGAGCEVGPFTHLRKGTVLEDGAELGNFCESKNSVLGARSKAKHLSYLGDARIGARVNVGAGTIFANYDGVSKHTTTVGDEAFIGSGTTIVAPNQLGARSTTGANSVVTRTATVGEDEVWVGIPARKLPGAKSAAQLKVEAREARESAGQGK